MSDSPDPRPVRPLSAIDLAGVAEALDSRPFETSWWYDPATGEVEMGPGEGMYVELDEEQDDPLDRGSVRIDSEGSRAAYADMVDFAEAVGDRRAADVLQRALPGQGAFRRFRDALHEFPDLLERWNTYAGACADTRAIRWLAAERFVDDDDARAALQQRAATIDATLDAVGRSHDVAVDVEHVAERWSDIERAIDAGHDVILQRRGRPWATITRT